MGGGGGGSFDITDEADDDLDLEVIETNLGEDDLEDEDMDLEIDLRLMGEDFFFGEVSFRLLLSFTGGLNDESEDGERERVILFGGSFSITFFWLFFPFTGFLPDTVSASSSSESESLTARVESFLAFAAKIPATNPELNFLVFSFKLFLSSLSFLASSFFRSFAS